MKKKPAVPLGATEMHRNPRPLLRLALIVATYLFVFILLDFITRQFEVLQGVVTWYPPAGLTYALLLVFGTWFAPAVTIALFISSLFIYRMPQSPYMLFLWAFIISLIYSLAAVFLRKRIRFDWQLRKLRDVTWLVFTTVFVSALLAVLSVSSSALSSEMPRSEVLRAIFHWWIGETVGVLTVTPFLLIYAMPWLKRFTEGQPIRLPVRRSFPRPTLSAIGQAASLVLTLYWVFGAPVLDEFHPLYLIALPLIWIALQRGLKGISVAILALNSGVVLALWVFRFDLARLGDLELLMIVNCIVGLLMGAVVTERKRAEALLLESELKFHTLFDRALDGILIADMEMRRFVLGNNAIGQMLGYTQDELSSLGVDDIHPQEHLPYVVEQFTRQKRGEITLAEDIPIRRKNGSIFYADINSTPVTLSGRAYMLGVFRDITLRKQREEEILSRSQELTTLYQLSRALADANDLENVINLVIRHAVESIHITFACIALLEDGDLLTRAVYPVRSLDHDFNIGGRQPITALPCCQRVLEQNEPVLLQAKESEVSRVERATLLLDFAQSVCLVPLRVGDPSQNLNQALGVLILGEAREEKREPFTPAKVSLARSIGDQAATAIRRLLSREQADRRLERLASLSEIDRTIASNFDLRLSLQSILEHVSEQLGVDAADVLVLNPSLHTLDFAAGRGFRSTDIERTRLRLGEGQASRAALERSIVKIPDVAASRTAFARPELMKAEQVAAYFAVPLITKGQVKGVLEVYHRTALKPNEEWLDFLNTLAGQAAIAIDNVQLFENLQRSNTELVLAYDATIEGWSHALDQRDKETEGHTLRVTKMTVELAVIFGLSESELAQVRWGALLHDIGKLGVPDNILLKPGPLTDEEWVVMRKHPTLAYEMLSPIHYLHAALDIPYCHHEKWDGTGYPRGLKGEQIPLTARIFAVVDVWDALTSDRPYRKAWSKEKARQHIQAEAGSHFDPQVVKTFFLEHGQRSNRSMI
jgi:PAS domain S-box-containing protein